jgi:inosine-uridine nucleoside N-ribohydrolase
MTPTRIILDCDPGHDDAIALLLALASPEVDLLGVTTVSGNHTVERTTANALRLLEFLGRTDVPVAAGATGPLVRPRVIAEYVHGVTGMDGPDLPPPAGSPIDRHAVTYLAETIREHAGEVTLVPTGPLTNIALLLAMYPDARPERIVLMGGAIGEGNRSPAAEFNIWADPEAARCVFESGIETTMIGLDVTHQALVTRAHAERLRVAGRVGKVVAELLDFYLRFHEVRWPELGGSPMHDPVAVLEVIRPDLLDVRPARIDIDCGWEQGRGRTNVDYREREDGLPPNNRVAVGIDADAFAELLIERITSLG